MKTFRHAVIVITGAGSGIGRALALQLAAEGARLALSDVSVEGLAETARQCEAVGAARPRTDLLDVADRDAFVAYADTIVDHFGVVNVMVNNAGVALNMRAEDQSFEDIDWLMNINLGGVITGTQAFLPHLIASGDGHLVNISSLYGIITTPGTSVYHAAKFGVRGYTESIAQEMTLDGHRVGVHCVHPGGIATNIARSARSAEADGEDGLAAAFDKLARTTPEQAAAIILRGVRRGRSRILVGPDAVALYLVSQLTGTFLQKLTPRLYDRIAAIPRPVRRPAEAATSDVA